MRLFDFEWKVGAHECKRETSSSIRSEAHYSLSLSLSTLSLSFLNPTTTKTKPVYHAFIFFIPPLFRKATFRVPAAARAARSRWLDLVASATMDSATQTVKSVFWSFFFKGRRNKKKNSPFLFSLSLSLSLSQQYAVQTIRNSIMAASFTASTCGLIAVSGLLPAILDGAKIGRLRELAALDPITRWARGGSEEEKAAAAAPPGWPSVEFKLSVMELVIISSFIAYMQCIRFNVYLT